MYTTIDAENKSFALLIQKQGRMNNSDNYCMSS